MVLRPKLIVSVMVAAIIFFYVITSLEFWRSPAARKLQIGGGRISERLKQNLSHKLEPAGLLQDGVGHISRVAASAGGGGNHAETPVKAAENSWPENVKEESMSTFLPRLLHGHFQTTPNDTKFTIQMLTYNRMDILPKLLSHYASFKSIHRLVILWNNVNATPPLSLWDTVRNATEKRNIKPEDFLFVIKQSENKLTNRMRLSKRVMTNCVFSLDDDLLFLESDVEVAFEAWKLLPSRFVGFFPRLHSLDAKTDRFRYITTGKEMTKQYSLMLTGAVMMHRDYFELFRYIPEDVFKMVDKLRNCEDIVMNVFAALMLQNSPAVLVWETNREILTSEKFHGLYNKNKKKHLQTRNFCMNVLMKRYNVSTALSKRRVVVGRYHNVVRNYGFSDEVSIHENLMQKFMQEEQDKKTKRVLHV